METLWSIVTTVLWWALGWVWWLLSSLFWLLAWFVLPLLVAAFIAVRVAEAAIGRTIVRTWLRTQSIKYGGGLGRRIGRFLLAIGTLPGRVLFWLVVYTLWHSVLSLMYTPRWKPWQRAWNRRWRQPKIAIKS